jgi:hypothetical protein
MDHRMIKQQTYLIAHTDHKDANTAQAEVPAESQSQARQTFAKLYPERTITKMGIKGEEDIDAA